MADCEKRITTATAAEQFAQRYGSQLRAHYTTATVEVVRTAADGSPDLTYMDKLEDAIGNWSLFSAVGLGGLGSGTRALQMRMLPHFPNDVRKCIEAHWQAWDTHLHPIARGSNMGKMGGIRLIDGGPDAVHKAAQTYAEKHVKKKRAKKSGDNKLQLFMFSLKLDPELYPDWTDGKRVTLALAKQGDILSFASMLKSKLEGAGMVVAEAYAILHNRDVYTIEDCLENAGMNFVPGAPKDAHVHMIVRATDSKSGLTLAAAARALQIAENFIEKPKTGRHAYENMLAYLIHIKYEGKTQYLPNEVVTLCGMPYERIWDERHEVWAQGRASVTRKKLAERVDWLQRECACGRIRREDIMRVVPDGKSGTEPGPLYQIYTCSKRARTEIDAALESATELRLATSAEALRNHEFEKVNYYIHGPSRAGKTQFAESILDTVTAFCPLPDAMHWRYNRLPSGHPLEQFDGSEVVIINEMRSSTFDYQAFLTFADQRDCDPVAARYRNRPAGAQRVTLVTTPTPPLQLFNFMRGVGGGMTKYDSLDQAIARLNYVIEVIDPRAEQRYRYRLYWPQYIKAGYDAEIVTGEDEFGDEIKENFHLHWRLTPFDALLSIDSLCELIVRDIDARCNGGNLIRSGAIGDAIHAAQKNFRERIAPAIDAGNLPPIEPLPPLLPGKEVSVNGD